MNARLRAWLWAVAATAALAGCGPATSTPAGTGARETAESFYEAVIRQDWPAAHAALDPDVRKRLSPEQFARLAAQYRRGLGLEPEAVHVRSCEEHGTEAIAHVTLTGRGPTGHGQYRDSVLLRKNGSTWGVVLPPNFGQAKHR